LNQLLRVLQLLYNEVQEPGGISLVYRSVIDRKPQFDHLAHLGATLIRNYRSNNVPGREDCTRRRRRNPDKRVDPEGAKIADSYGFALEVGQGKLIMPGLVGEHYVEFRYLAQRLSIGIPNHRNDKALRAIYGKTDIDRVCDNYFAPFQSPQHPGKLTRSQRQGPNQESIARNLDAQRLAQLATKAHQFGHIRLRLDIETRLMQLGSQHPFADKPLNSRQRNISFRRIFQKKSLFFCLQTNDLAHCQGRIIAFFSAFTSTESDTDILSRR
jgi:hypothetical protein